MSPEHSGPQPPQSTRLAEDVAGTVRGGNSARRAVLGRFARLFNPLIRWLAGRRGVSPFAVLRHRGRRSGRWYATPVTALPMGDGFVVPLTFGEGADWFQNVRAAGGCVIRWNGAEYSLAGPTIIDWAAARSAFNPLERVLVPIIGVERFVWLRRETVGD
jgi:deazaflavin-dependent oxidoreductase (nitroreductase family)